MIGHGQEIQMSKDSEMELKVGLVQRTMDELSDIWVSKEVESC